METFRDIKNPLFNAATNNKSQFTLCPNVLWSGWQQSTQWNHTKVSKCEQPQTLLFLSAIKVNSAPGPQAGCLIYFLSLWSHIGIFLNLINANQVG